MTSALTYFAVFVGSALGGVARFWLGNLMMTLTGPRFPWGTLLINVLGSFVIGLTGALTLAEGRLDLHPDLRIFIMVGLCGGFTTFSAFSLQTLVLLQAGEVAAGVFYIAASVLICLISVWLGWVLGRP